MIVVTLYKGSVDVNGREHSVEVLSLHHGISLPIDNHSGKMTGNRNHLPFLIEKELDTASAYLCKAVTTGKSLKQVELKYYRINNQDYEEEYNTLLENARIVNVMPVMFDVKDIAKEKFNHMEVVEFSYEKITWHYPDGNIKHSDKWYKRT